MNWYYLVQCFIQWLKDFSLNYPAPADTAPHVSPPSALPEPAPEAPVGPPPSPKPPAPAPVPPKPSVPLAGAFCLGIQSREGYLKPGEDPDYPRGTPAWRNNNPGNLKMGPFAKGCGAIGQDESGFAVFPSYAAGFTALQTLVHNAATGVSSIYHPDMLLYNAGYSPTLYGKYPSEQAYWPGFFQLYSPSGDNNDPKSYASEVGGKLGVDYQTFQIKNLV